MKTGAFLSFMAAAAVMAGGAAAVETIRAEDEALLEGIFSEGGTLKGAEGRLAAPSAAKDAARVSTAAAAGDAARVSAVPAARTLRYPLKAEREAARAEEGEWFDARESEALRHGEKPRMADDPLISSYRDGIAKCLDGRADRLDLEKGMLYSANAYDGAAYLAETLEEINGCYEDIGYSIINAYYGGDPEAAAKFRDKAEGFYISGTDVDFDPKFCGDNCSLDAVAEAQMAKFAEFRVYLAELLANRPQGL